MFGRGLAFGQGSDLRDLGHVTRNCRGKLGYSCNCTSCTAFVAGLIGWSTAWDFVGIHELSVLGLFGRGKPFVLRGGVSLLLDISKLVNFILRDKATIAGSLSVIASIPAPTAATSPVAMPPAFTSLENRYIEHPYRLLGLLGMLV
jgi:hypothetical protein